MSDDSKALFAFFILLIFALRCKNMIYKIIDGLVGIKTVAFVWGNTLLQLFELLPEYYFYFTILNIVYYTEYYFYFKEQLIDKLINQIWLLSRYFVKKKSNKPLTSRKIMIKLNFLMIKFKLSSKS